MSNFKVKMRCSSPLATREVILKILNNISVKCSRINRINDELLLIYCCTPEDVDIIFTPDAISKFNTVDCEPVAPPDLQAKRSLIVKRVDDCIYTQSEIAVKAELLRSNPWMFISSIFKFPNSKTIKVTFNSQDLVRRALSQGIYLFGLSISPANMSQEEFINILTCFKCYKWNDHATSNCKKDASFVVCSLCSSNQHTYKECQSQVRKCINCSGSHSTISYSCPRRKEIANTLISASASRGATSSTGSAASTYASIVTPPNPSKLGNISEGVIKSAMCLILASLKRHDSTENFQSSVSRLLRINKLPPLDIGDIEPPVVDIDNLVSTCEASLDIVKDRNRSLDDGTGDDDNAESSLSESQSTAVDSGAKRRKKKNKKQKHGDVNKGVTQLSNAAKRDNAEARTESPVAAAIQRFSKRNLCNASQDYTKNLRSQNK